MESESSNTAVVIRGIFDDIITVSSDHDEAVLDQLDTKKTRSGAEVPTTSLLNIHKVLSLDPRWAGRIRLNQFDGYYYLFDEGGEAGTALADHIETDINLWLQEVYAFPDMPTSKVAEVVRHIAESNGFHPIRDYLMGLRWDGKPRAHRWLVDICKVEDTKLHQELGRRFLISAVARVMEPGCKVDTVLVLKGAQGDFKSTAIKELFSAPWFSDTPLDIRNKDAYVSIRGVWGYELAELEATRGRDVTAVKAFLAAAVDKYRAAYARNDRREPRQGVFIATTNEQTFLNDGTGSRRFWPVEVRGVVDVDRITEWRDQLWAEALTLYLAGEQWWLDNDLEKLRQEAAEEFSQVDPWKDAAEDWLGGRSGGVKVAEVIQAVAKKEVGDQTRGDQLRMANALTSMGWRKRQVRTGVGSGRVYLWFGPNARG